MACMRAAAPEEHALRGGLKEGVRSGGPQARQEAGGWAMHLAPVHATEATTRSISGGWMIGSLRRTSAASEAGGKRAWRLEEGNGDVHHVGTRHAAQAVETERMARARERGAHLNRADRAGPSGSVLAARRTSTPAGLDVALDPHRWRRPARDPDHGSPWAKYRSAAPSGAPGHCRLRFGIGGACGCGERDQAQDHAPPSIITPPRMELQELR